MAHRVATCFTSCMRVATWNVNGLRARLEVVRRWLEAEAPDLVGLQELKLEEEHFPHDAFAELGYHAAVLGQKAWNGVAVLSREEASVVRRGLPGQEEMGARLLTAKVAGLTFATVYVPNGKHLEHPDFQRKLAWLDDLTRLLNEAHDPADALVLCGDFNICPAPIDSWNETALEGSIFHTHAERERVARLVEWGLVDIFRELHPERQEFSWWDYRGGAFHRRHGLRIDFLLATRSVLARTRAAEIHREWRKKQDGLTPSDHAPVVMDVE